jgi:hypothetical protein
MPRHRFSRKIATISAFYASAAVSVSHDSLASGPLTEAQWGKGDSGAVIVQLDWGRRWGCAGLDSSQLVRLVFDQQSPPAGQPPDRLELKTPKKLRIENRYIPVVMLLRPGTYALTGFEVKIANSMSHVRRIEMTAKDLIVDGKPTGGTFRVDAGEIVYIGGFGLDCNYEAVPWRYYIDSAERFEDAVAKFRQHFPYTRDAVVRYRLFESERFAEPPEFHEGKIPPIDVPPDAPAPRPARSSATPDPSDSGRA